MIAIDRLFDTVLVANRGEIARRVIRTLRRLQIRSVAVYSDADIGAPHVREADAAVRIGGRAPSHSYLDIDAVIAAAAHTGSQAIHPGYGFLSENAAFARACTDAGIVFIGPGQRALDIMADKIRAKEHVAGHGVPVVPGFSAREMDDAAIVAEACRVGFPLLIKPSAGGGGKGMQVVGSVAEMPEALAAARRVALAAFGDDSLLLERLIDAPRHIEVQVLADAHGTVIHLGERECTLQRRHQKVVEEAPSPIVDAATRERLGAAACAAAASVEYRGAGTVEFLVSGERPDDFFFIEMNTRLQVEHPVTEMVTGYDLVEAQLRIAAGREVGIAQQSVRMNGHAIEARVYAESPERGFLPATGDVLLWRAPDSEGVRVDGAVETGSAVTADYDPMIAKVIAWGEDRAQALSRLDAALAETVVLGLDTNIRFLRALLADSAVVAGELDTGLIDRMPPAVEAPAASSALDSAARFVASAAAESHTESRDGAATELWSALPGWRMAGPPNPARMHFLSDDDSLSEGHSDAPIDSDAAVAQDVDGAVWVHVNGDTHRLRPLSRRAAMQRRLDARTGHGDAATDPILRAPMPGTVVAVHVPDGAHVSAGARVVTIEAMKMEHSVVAAHDGMVTLDVAVGEQVRRDQTLARVDALQPTT